MSHKGTPWPDLTYMVTYGPGARRQCHECRGIIVWVAPARDGEPRAGYWKHLPQFAVSR